MNGKNQTELSIQEPCQIKIIYNVLTIKNWIGIDYRIAYYVMKILWSDQTEQLSSGLPPKYPNPQIFRSHSPILKECPLNFNTLYMVDQECTRNKVPTMV